MAKKIVYPDGFDEWFNKDGDLIKPFEECFDSDENFIPSEIVDVCWEQFKADSDVVKWHYCLDCSNATSGNYEAELLFERLP